MKMNLNDFLTFNYCKFHIKYTPKVSTPTQNLFTTKNSQKHHKTPLLRIFT